MEDSRMRSLTAMLLLAAISVFATFSAAQVTTGTISGTVSDTSGAVVAGAKVEITNEGTGATRQATTGPDGHYTVPQLPVGNYKIGTTMEGFKSELRQGINLTIGSQA